MLRGDSAVAVQGPTYKSLEWRTTFNEDEQYVFAILR